MYLISCTNTHRDVIDSVNHEMVKNTKTWVSWERNVIFLRNKKILNLCLRWYILSSYRFVAEITVKAAFEVPSSCKSNKRIILYITGISRNILKIIRRISTFQALPKKSTSFNKSFPRQPFQKSVRVKMEF